MTDLLWILGGVLVTLWLLWWNYIACMGMLASHQAHTLSRSGYVLGAVPFVVNVLMDVLLNFTLASLFFLRWPVLHGRKEFTLSIRLGNYLADPGWRGAVARWIGPNLLDYFDPDGKHLHG